MRRAEFWAVAAVLAALGSAGCSPGRGDVSGKVMFRGKPVVYGSVVFTGQDGLPMAGEIKPDGTYALAKVLGGVNRVTVHSPDPATGGRITKSGSVVDKPQVDRKMWFPIPDAFGDIEKSGLKFTLNTGSNAIDINLP